MPAKNDIRLIVPMKGHNAADVALRDRVEIAAKTLGCTKGDLMKACLNGALDTPSVFHKHLRERR